MKRWIASLAALLMICCTAWAAETVTGTVSGGQSIDVNGNRVDRKNYYEITLGIAGMDSVELPEKITLSGVSDAAADRGLRVVIIPVTAGEEPQAFAWLSGAAASLGQEPVAYYLAFYRGSTPVRPQGSVTITMTSRAGYEQSRLYYMDGDAKAKVVSTLAGRGNYRFGMAESGYYLLVKVKDTSPSVIVRPSNPGTGAPAGSSLAALSAALLMMGALGFAIHRKRK